MLQMLPYVSSKKGMIELRQEPHQQVPLRLTVPLPTVNEPDLSDSNFCPSDSDIMDCFIHMDKRIKEPQTQMNALIP